MFYILQVTDFPNKIAAGVVNANLSSYISFVGNIDDQHIAFFGQQFFHACSIDVPFIVKRNNDIRAFDVSD